MPMAVRFDRYGDLDVLDVVEVPRPSPADGQVLVRVRAASINPGEAKIRIGALHDRFPASFPSGEGSDLAGVVEELGSEITGFAPGDAVLGFVHTRSSHAEYAVVDADKLIAKPAELSWEVAGSLYVAGATAWAMVRAVSIGAGDTVIVAGATGGVGSLAVQLARNAGATVLGIASDRHSDWLREHGVVPISYERGPVAERVRAALRDGGRDQETLALDGSGVMLDARGGGYVELALELGIRPERIDTVVDFGAGQRHGVKTAGSAEGSTREALSELASLAATGRLDIPIAASYPLVQVREAFRALEQDHPLGKIVLLP